MFIYCITNKSESLWSKHNSSAGMKKKPTINPLNDDDKYFQYAATVALNHEEIAKSYKEYQK